MKRRLIREYEGVPTADQFPAVRNWSAVLNTLTGTIYTLVGGVPTAVGSGGGASWGTISGTLSNQTDLQTALNAKAASSHTHDYAASSHTHDYAASGHNHDLAYSALGHTHAYEPANANIQAHVASAHAPSNAQKNSDITKAEIEAKLTGEIATHTHAGGGGGQSHVVAAGASDSAAVSNSNVNHFSKVVTVSAGDVFWFEVHGRIHNNSGATRTYTHGIGLGGLTLDCVASTTIAANTIAAFFVWGTIAVRSTSSVYWTVQQTTLPVSADNGAAVTSVSRHAWRTSATDITGSQTALSYIRGSGTGTQNRWVHGYILRQIGSI